MKAWVIILLIGLNTVSALGVVNNQYRKRLTVIEMRHLSEIRDVIIDKRSQLLVEYAAWSANARIERLAIEHLNMRYGYDNYLYLGI